MSLRHVIVEGPDGAGKTTFIDNLAQRRPELAIHKRASTSLGGPVADLAQWVVRDVNTMPAQVKSIYDRHPIISEPIYANIRTVNPGLRGVWTTKAFAPQMKMRMSSWALLVVCLPPLAIVTNNIRQSEQLAGVDENIGTLWHAYSMLSWPGVQIRYDYTTSSLDRVVNTIGKVLADG